MGDSLLAVTHAVWELRSARSWRAPQLSDGVRRISARRGSPPDRAAFVIFNAEDAFVHPSEFQRSKVYVPEAVVDFFEADVLAGKRVSHADPVLLPANAAIAT